MLLAFFCWDVFVDRLKAQPIAWASAVPQPWTFQGDRNGHGRLQHWTVLGSLRSPGGDALASPFSAFGLPLIGRQMLAPGELDFGLLELVIQPDRLGLSADGLRMGIRPVLLNSDARTVDQLGRDALLDQEVQDVWCLLQRLREASGGVLRPQALGFPLQDLWVRQRP
ncbi:hypothetical protein ACFWOJ_35915 [Streptomyces sp. NPDC058439]|uniref:hypothetical protein n=1 Tax=Streptomyces sp. NPDC058439 TaxID=3346500 RepID=UPI0036610DB3